MTDVPPLSVGRVFLSWIPSNVPFMSESSNSYESKYDTFNPSQAACVCLCMYAR